MNEQAMNGPIVYYDGVCGFCNKSVQFILRNDRRGIMKFATLQGTHAQNHLDAKFTQQLDGLVTLIQGKVYFKSSGFLILVPHLAWYWQWMMLGWIFPRFMRDAVYNLIAKYRYVWFGRYDACPIPTPEQRSRFMLD
ncbi:MAG: thiol-disulfide oxidoreductase DCC family protein [Flavobacteriales bacterium]